jgi:hypothetical protein
VVDPNPQDPDETLAARRRTILFTAVGAVVAGALLFAVVTRVSSTNQGTTSTDAGGRRVAQFDLGRAKDFAPTIEGSGPLLFPDPQGNTRDIFVQHLGGDQWLAFEARVAGAPRQCVLRWEPGPKRFVDPCDGRTYPADGAGLVSFPTKVNEKGRVIVDLSNPIPPTTAPATPAY